MDMDKKICHQSERIRQLLQQPDGEKLSGLSRFLIDIAPWLLRTLGSMEVGDLILIHGRLKALKLETHDPLLHVHGFESPPPNALISVALAKSGASLSSLANATRNAVASLPIVGSITGMDAHAQKLHEDLGKVNINGNIPESWEDWKTVANAMRHSQLVHAFENEIWKPNVRSDQWPDLHFSDQHNVREMIELLEKGISVKNLISKLKATEELDRAADCRELDARRGKVSSQIRHHAEELVDAAVVAELSRSFSPDAQSALICFSQIAGAAKFSKSSKPSKMTQRQRRRRQEYLDAFDRCCRFIPCWILTTSQISDYLPPECLFDLVVIDEASQSDVTVLPGMLRGKQWLIVGDGKQVSPTEGFVSEEEIDNLRAALPPGPLESSLLPGHSFFDMCAQAFPRGRVSCLSNRIATSPNKANSNKFAARSQVVLSEHFRCAPDIIGFSNEQFYDERLVPLRLPTQSERLSPSLMDVKIDGVKRGKVNEKEADRIVELVQESISLPGSESKPRTIGIISLVGDEQSRLIRGRLLDALGPEKMARHDILIGDPPTFQGAERDIVFLSMVCSRGSVPTQSQLMHFQRANVAMSRARDRCVLVRSIELTDIPSLDDMKIPIIEFFLKNGSASSEETRTANEGSGHKLRKGTSILKNLLQQQGFLVTAMGVIWKDAICVDHINAETRVAIMVDCENESPQEWLSSYTQQKAIERVGWKCLRIDVLSLLIDFRRTMEYVIKYLASAGIEKPTEVDDDEHHQAEPQIEDAVMEVNGEQFQEGLFNGPENDQEVVTVSSEDDLDDRKPAAAPDRTSNSFDFSQEDSDKPSQFGQVVGLDFLRGRTDEEFDSGDDEQFYSINAENGRKRNRKPEVEYSGETEYQNDETNRTGQFDDESGSGTRHNPLEVNNDINNDIIPRSIRTEQVHDNRNFARRSERAGLPNDSSSVLRDSESSGEEQSETGFTSLPSTRSKRRYKRLDKYSRDGRYYPKGNMANGSDHEWMYDTDSDLPRHKVDDGDAVGDGVLFAQSNNQPTEREGKGST